MTAVLVTFGLALFTVIAPTRALFIGMGGVLTAAYLFASNIPLQVLGIEEFIRYSKEPFIVALLARYAITAWDSHAFGRRSAALAGPAHPRILASRGAVLALLFLLVWSVVSVVQTGLVGFAGYVRGVIFPAVMLLYLNGVDDVSVRKLGDGIAVGAVALLAFLLLVSTVHLHVDPNFLIPESFRNRLDYDEPYRSLVAYGDIRRYQSFFGDPNRSAIVCILALWFCSIGKLRPLRWVIFALVAALLWLTQSRTGMLVAGLWGLYLFVRPNPSRDMPVVAMIGLLIVSTGVGMWVVFSTRAGSIEEVSRAILWMGVAQHIVSSAPLFLFGEGFGWVGQTGGTFAVSEAIQLTSASGRTVALNVIDNSYLTIVSSLGAVGAVAVFAFYRAVLTSMAAHIRSSQERRQFWMLASLIAFWAMFFDALVSYPWTFLFPLVLRYAVAGAPSTGCVDVSARGQAIARGPVSVAPER